MIDFPASPTNGQVFINGGQSWTWDGVKWVPSGTTVMPPLATGDNRIINGDMRIDQRNQGAGGTAGGYTIDRWNYGASQASKVQWGRIAGPAVLGFPYCFAFTSSSAYASLAADNFNLNQPIEADFVSDFAWGTPSAQPVTLSFLVFSSLTGTFSGSLCNNGATRSYPFTFPIPTANTWTKIVITIPGDTGGTWLMSGNGVGVYVRFDLGSGTTNRGPANAWATTTSPGYIGVTGAVSVVGTNAASFYLTGVKLEVGSVATPYNRQTLAKSMADCQRYYQQFVYTSAAYAGAGTLTQPGFTLLTSMRAAPTAAIIGNVTYTNASALSFTPRGDGQTVNPVLTVTATGGFAGTATVSFNAEL